MVALSGAFVKCICLCCQVSTWRTLFITRTTRTTSSWRQRSRVYLTRGSSSTWVFIDIILMNGLIRGALALCIILLSHKQHYAYFLKHFYYDPTIFWSGRPKWLQQGWQSVQTHLSPTPKANVPFIFGSNSDHIYLTGGKYLRLVTDALWDNKRLVDGWTIVLLHCWLRCWILMLSLLNS